MKTLEQEYEIEVVDENSMSPEMDEELSNGKGDDEDE